MINKFFLAIIISFTLVHCGFSPIYTGNFKQVIISKSEIVGNKDLAFNLEQKLNFKKDEKNLNAYVFKAQIYDTAESSIVDSRGISTEEIIKLTVSYQFQDKNGVVIYQDAISKDKRVSVTDNLSNNILVKIMKKEYY
jgi:3-deoxy-D-manno-octulosonic acid (KDO) 8-phosphate synthase